MLSLLLIPISAIVPSRGRRDSIHKTLAKIYECVPRPAQVLVHLDDPPVGLCEALIDRHSGLEVFVSSSRLGPGGARGRLIEASKYELVASFDDDSFPESPDYFARVLLLAERFPRAAMFSAASQAKEWESMQFQQIPLPSGCGCVFRRSWFKCIWGFVPLPVAYNMEEVDIGLQLQAVGGVIVHDPLLRVVHDRIPDGEINADINAKVLANTALFPFLRFPVWFWPLGIWSVCRRLQWMIQQDWTIGLLLGVRMIPMHLWQFREYRHPVSSRALISWLRLKRRPVDLGDAREL